MTGEQAIAAFDKANALVKARRFDEARAMKGALLPSDWTVIEERIEAATKNSCANRILT